MLRTGQAAFEGLLELGKAVGHEGQAMGRFEFVKECALVVAKPMGYLIQMQGPLGYFCKKGLSWAALCSAPRAGYNKRIALQWFE